MDIENPDEDMQIEPVVPKKPLKKENLPWVEKYRPAKLVDLISHDSIIQTCSFSL